MRDKKGKKKIIAAVGIALVLALAVPGFVYAADSQNGMPGKADATTSQRTYAASTTAIQGYGRHFVDENGDGICDYYQNGRCGAGCVDLNGDGICDFYNGGGRGPGFVDADGDDICDNLGTGRGTGNGLGGGMGRGSGYVDANNDGICDNYNGQGGSGPGYQGGSRGGQGNRYGR